jgi:hypothetical protein
MRINFSEEKILSAKNALEVIFPNTKTKNAAELYIDWLKEKGGQATKTAVSSFADSLQTGQVLRGNLPFRYSRRNFYMTVLRTLVNLGFIQKNVPIWDSTNRRTHYVYMRNIFDIPQKPPSVGFWRLCYYVCRKWNEQFINQRNKKKTASAEIEIMHS